MSETKTNNNKTYEVVGIRRETFYDEAGEIERVKLFTYLNGFFGFSNPVPTCPAKVDVHDWVSVAGPFMDSVNGFRYKLEIVS